MASSPSRTTAVESGKTAPETAHSAGRGIRVPKNYFQADFALRLLLFAASAAALVVLVTSKETETVPAPFLVIPPILRSNSAQFQDSPALIYLLAALSVTCLYSVLSMFTSAFAARRSGTTTALLFHLVVLDALMAGVLAAATGAGGAVAYIGLKGNSHVQWRKICGVYGMFCRHIGSACAVSLFASIVLVALVILSAYSLYRRSR